VRLSHFYHVYADGDWEIPATEHFEELRVSGLLDELDGIYLGVVGSRENRRKVKRALRHHVIVEADEGWEQVTLNAVHDFAQTDSGAIFYAHTKGAWSQSELARQWRVSMTHDTVTRWRECVQALYTVQAAGPFWLKSYDFSHLEHEHFFAGNFWWAQSEYVAALPPLKNENRFQAEGWIGLGMPSVSIMREGDSYFGNFWSANENT
jgi:hypothetical protein